MVSSLLSPSATNDRVQLDLFPLHPSTTTLEDDPHDEHISRFFPSDDAITIHSLLGTQYSSSPAASEGKHSPSSSSASYSACSSSYGSVGGPAAAAAGLARAALRGRERWWWAEEEEEEGEAASCGSAGLLSGATRRLSLKLDYDGILNAWSGERLPFIEGGDGPQVVPDLRRTTVPHQYATVFVDVAGCGGGLWTVPDGGAGSGPATEGGGEGGGHRAEEEGDVGKGQGEGEEGMAAGGREDREARVMRYKEKRRHRLFAKRIAYEVRKLNAEKRPRVKVIHMYAIDDVHERKCNRTNDIDGLLILRVDFVKRHDDVQIKANYISSQSSSAFHV